MYDLTGAVWRKSSRSNSSNNCVEVAQVWRKSSRSNNNNNNCVEVAAGGPGFDGVVAVRDSKDPSGPVLVFQPEDWTAFLQSAHGGHYDINR